TEASGAASLYLLVQVLADARDLALEDPVHTECLHQVIDAACGDALDVRLLDDGHQGPLSPFAWLEQRGKEAAIPHPRHAQLNGPDPRIPLPIPIAVALAQPGRGPLVAFGAEVLADLQLHQRLAQHTHAVPQELPIMVEFRLAQEL